MQLLQPPSDETAESPHVNGADPLPSGRCPLCGLAVPQLVSHIRDAHCRSCGRCGLILPEALMERHRTAHDLKMAFWCPVCGQREDQRQRMMHHIGEQHEYIAEGSQFQCGSCGHVRSHNLITHCLKHARDDALTAYWFKPDADPPPGRRVEPQVIGEGAGHTPQAPCDDADSDSAPEGKEMAPGEARSSQKLDVSDEVDAETLACELCGRVLRSVSQLRRHRRYRHGEWRGPLHCARCSRRFFLAVHLRVHTCAGGWRLSAEPWLSARLWRPEATLGALWCPSCCQPQVSLHQLRLHSLRQHADVL
ncbi:zinc finger protein 497-like [Pollicipes pollicipes]|uniref:zinc finger protein 497-like n=1 Tax=Pollicipes pollicipes TaxID=41117 RepID=UPI00188557DC|nr:zinc finger protein 497-like [Pollicipes pollicipes]